MPFAHQHTLEHIEMLRNHGDMKKDVQTGIGFGIWLLYRFSPPRVLRQKDASRVGLGIFYFLFNQRADGR